MKLFFLIISMLIFSSCGNKYENILISNTSEIRECLCVGESEELSASLTVGMREKNYIVNGYSTELIEFGVLSFELRNIDVDKNNCQFILFVGTDKYTGDLQENPFDQTLVADIQKVVDCNKKIVARLISNNVEIDVELFSINRDWNITSSDVYKIIAKNLKDEIKAFINNNIFEGEVYIKIINDQDITKNDYYWYVNIIGRNGKRLSAIVSPIKNEILAKNSYL